MKNQPVEINIDYLIVVLGQKSSAKALSEKSYYEYSRDLVHKAFNETRRNLEAAKNSKEEGKRGRRFLQRAFDNFKLKIKKIDFRLDYSNSPQKSRFSSSFGTTAPQFSLGGYFSDVEVTTVDAKGLRTFIQRDSQFDPIMKMITFREFNIYYDDHVLENGGGYLEYLNKKRSSFQNIFSVKMKLYLTINNYNPKEKRNKPIYSFFTNVREIGFAFSEDSVTAFRVIMEDVKEHQRQFQR